MLAALMYEAPPGQGLSLLVTVASGRGRGSKAFAGSTGREAIRQLLKNPI